MRQNTASGVILAISMTLLAACGGGDKAPDEGAVQDRATPVATIAARSDAESLLYDVQAYMEDVDSLSGRFAMEGSSGGVPLDIDAAMAVRMPNEMFMTMDVAGQQIEVLAVGSNFYVNIPGRGWHLADLAEVGLNADSLDDLFQNRGAVDVDALVESAESISALPDEEIDGQTYRRIRVAGDFQRMTEASSSLLTGAAAELLKDAEGDLQSDWWIEQDEAAPRRVVVAMDVDAPSFPLEMTITMDFEEFNGAVDIPEEPVGAPPVSSLQD